MANANPTPSPSFIPRPPNEAERQQLAGWLESQGYEPEVAAATSADAYVAVYERYCTGSPGYCGKLMSVVWDGAPSFFDVFIWDHEQMIHSGRDSDEKQCSRCGAIHGTLCWDCWRRCLN